jgi:emfourin
MSESECRVELERSGGFAGVTRHAILDAGDFSPAERRGLDALLVREAAGREAIRGMPDEFQYDVTVVCGARRHRVRLAESDLDEVLGPLIRRLETESRPAA